MRKWFIEANMDGNKTIQISISLLLVIINGPIRYSSGYSVADTQLRMDSYTINYANGY